MKLLETLNKAQKAAVEYNSGPHLIVAGAGSGKTKVLTYKIAYLIEKGFDPSNILALTFTNKAANEMKSRIKELVGKNADKIWMGTFHSIFARILRVEAKKLNYEPNFSIYDKEDSVSLVSNIIQELNISLDNFNANAIHHKISNLKNRMITPEEYEKQFAKTLPEKKIFEIYKNYNIRLFENNSMDFDDLLLKPIELFNKNQRVLTKYRGMFKYILVDEYQDTNKAQYELIKLIVTSRIKICVVGDDAQSIYGWRGAEVQNMFDFEKDFNKVRVFRLEQNYRSTKMILNAADSVIKQNKKQIQKTLWTENNDGEQLTILKCADEKDEAFQISKKIKKEVSSKKLSLNDIAILYRINAQSRVLEDAMRREKIPYKIVGGVEFYRRKEVKDIVAYLRVFANQNDEESLLRIMNFPQRGIGNTSVSKMIDFSRKLEISLFETMARVFEVIEVKERIQKNVKQFKLLLDKYIDLKSELSLAELTSALVDELGILRLYKEENSQDSRQRYENVQELLKAIQEFTKEKPDATIEDFLAEVSLISGIDQYDEESNKITMMTIHSAKGLEFPVVFITGCEEDIFPLNNRFDPDANIDEERRLFYVAITRAQQKVFITYARSRYRFGEVAYQSKSRFLEELDPATFTELNGGTGRKSGRRRKAYYDEMYQESYDDFDQERRSLRVGSRVTHEMFGQGKILQIAGQGDMQKVSINFEEQGVKTLLVKFANLKLI
ncbi:MAG: UvrD-helicase domain-containing protein [Melioribacteraceae bacterium]|nr:UvrD-helicase domain-containing protein [Melioribacteraceae bacterium]MCF8354546.1 UvrD-helicase domain-containing protein [Melioribacteraceae bacterium]MCF8394478.1 UvrD-helicase domain-containing protein [Melioribacteraceae bacterium]MCF8420112.1 UvrD-helicase domain-containing protein [Melioribacteraceae bacterium]